uniref:Uncharacterized protein n=1 Tax=Physcomitrium patens TaxID=3218 RepID=A0A2K1J9B3_PHYPA|nr:hypothetical protein PHYPA_021229 [Physcomitrium patens]
MPRQACELIPIQHMGQIGVKNVDIRVHCAEGWMVVVHSGGVGMVSLDVEKLQLGECVDKMSSEIADLKNTIVSKDKQKEHLQRALEDGATLEKSMVDEIQLQHRRAQELELEIERLQENLQRENTEATEGDVNSTLEMQNLMRVLHEHRAQLAEKTKQIDSYKQQIIQSYVQLKLEKCMQALINTAERLEGMPGESQEMLESAFEIAGSLRKLLQDRDKQFANLESTCLSREMEILEVQRKLELTDSTLSVTVGSRDARIRELENTLRAMEREVQDTQQQLQNVEQKIDANDSRAKKLELDLKLTEDDPNPAIIQDLRETKIKIPELFSILAPIRSAFPNSRHFSDGREKQET